MAIQTVEQTLADSLQHQIPVVVLIGGHPLSARVVAHSGDTFEFQVGADKYRMKSSAVVLKTA